MANTSQNQWKNSLQGTEDEEGIIVGESDGPHSPLHRQGDGGEDGADDLCGPLL